MIIDLLDNDESGFRVEYGAEREREKEMELILKECVKAGVGDRWGFEGLI